MTFLFKWSLLSIGMFVFLWGYISGSLFISGETGSTCFPCTGVNPFPRQGRAEVDGGFGWSKKKERHLAVYGWKTAGFYHILVCIPKQVVWIMGTYIMTMTMPINWWRILFLSTVAVDGAWQALTIPLSYELTIPHTMGTHNPTFIFRGSYKVITHVLRA